MLIVMAGLPAAGKSTIAEVVGNRMGVPVVSVDPIEAAILSAGIDADQPTGLAAYLVAEAFADSVISGGTSIIVDAVNAVSPAREQWLKLAERHAAEIRFIEVVCSDAALHEQRLAARAERLAAASLPEAVRGQFLDRFSHLSGSAFSAGSASAPQLPSSVPPAVADQIKAAALQAVHHGFATAVAETMLLAVAVFALGLVSALLMHGQRVQRRSVPDETPAPAAA